MRNVVALPGARSRWQELDRMEVDAAIAMVADGLAREIRLIGLGHPLDAAGLGAARAGAAGVAFRVDRSGTGVELVVGPRR